VLQWLRGTVHAIPRPDNNKKGIHVHAPGGRYTWTPLSIEAAFGLRKIYRGSLTAACGMTSNCSAKSAMLDKSVVKTVA
jgi:hypothetical protein